MARVNATVQNENEIAVNRLAVFNRLNKVSHRALGPIVAEFRAELKADPSFGGRCLVHIARTSRNRDAQEAAIIAMLQSDFPQFREAGQVLLFGNPVYSSTNVAVNGLEPFRVLRVLKYLASPVVVLHGQDEVERFYSEKAAKAALNRIANRLTVRANRGEKDWRKWKVKIEASSLIVRRDAEHVQARSRIETAINDWMKAMAAAPAWLDSVAILNRATMVEVVKHYRPKLDARSHGILLDGNYPSDSVFATIKKISETSDPAEKCRLAIAAKLPLRVATSVLGDLSGENATAQTKTLFGVTIVSLMTPAEATNSADWFSSSGLADIPEVKKAYLDKVAKDTKRGVSAREARQSAKSNDAEIEEAKNKATAAAVAKAAKIENDVLLLVDKSKSMDKAIERAVEVAAFIAPFCAGQLRVVTFNDTAEEIKVPAGQRNDINAWRREFALQTARSSTCMNVGFRVGLADGYRPQEIVIITDGQEYNPNGRKAANEWRNYSDANAPYTPHMTILKVGEYEATFENSMRALGLDINVLDDPSGKEGLDMVAESLRGKRGATMVETIMAVEIPARV